MLSNRYLAELLAAIAAGEPLTRAERRDLALEVLRLRRALGECRALNATRDAAPTTCPRSSRRTACTR